jgi:hypothetical protein
MNGEEGTEIHRQVFMNGTLGLNNCHEESITTLGDDADGLQNRSLGPAVQKW